MLYFVAYLDRVNVGFAALQMNAALGLSGDFRLGLRVLAASAIGSGLLVMSVGATAGKARESGVRVS